MINQVILVGRLSSDPVLNEETNNCYITLALPRAYKNDNGEYETDFIDCVLFARVASTTAEYCKKGDLIGVRGKLETIDSKTIVVAEKINFLTRAKTEE